jgi:hypothetical protein
VVNAINKGVEKAEKEKVRAGEEKIQQETAEIGNIAEVKEFTLGTSQGGLNFTMAGQKYPVDCVAFRRITYCLSKKIKLCQDP